MVDRLVRNEEAAGSIPAGSTARKPARVGCAPSAARFSLQRKKSVLVPLEGRGLVPEGYKVTEKKEKRRPALKRKRRALPKRKEPNAFAEKKEGMLVPKRKRACLCQKESAISYIKRKNGGWQRKMRAKKKDFFSPLNNFLAE